MDLVGDRDPLVSGKGERIAVRAIVDATARRGLEPVTPKQSDCEGERGPRPCLPLTRTVAWASSPNEQGREREWHRMPRLSALTYRRQSWTGAFVVWRAERR